MGAARDGAVRKLGEVLVDRGVLKPEQVGLLLDEQRTADAAGAHSRLGEIAVRRGWAGPDHVAAALRIQADEEIEGCDPGFILAAQGDISDSQLAEARRRSARSGESLEEALVDLRAASAERVRAAALLAAIRAANAARRITASSFSPYNVMELVVGEAVDEAIRGDGLCACSQCWSNAYALALNGMPARYVSDHARVPDYARQFREEYGVLARERVTAALSQVRANPKASCLSRFSAEILAGREAEAAVHEVPVRVSSAHVHVSREALERLFGRGAALSVLREMSQPGQFAATETVTVAGPKGNLEKVRIVGPLRELPQVEISGADQAALGITAPVRESGRLEGAPGVRLRGPAGEVALDHAVIRALRHVHMPPEEADRIGVRNGSRVSVRLAGDRAAIVEGVQVRVAPGAVLEMHIDRDEGNAAGVASESTGQILIPPRKA